MEQSQEKDNYYIYRNIEADIDKEGMLKSTLLIDSPLVPTLLTLYLLFVLKLGPALMGSRPPYNVKLPMRVFNIVKIVYNVWVLFLACSEQDAISYFMNHSCHPLVTEDTVHLQKLYLQTLWHYVALKHLELIDTIFMVLRKKTAHITYLHLYHHTAVAFLSWFSCKYMLSQQAALPGLINLIVNVVIHSYYFLATFGPGVQKYLRWKWLVSALQLTQFVVVILYLLVLHYFECEVSRDFAFLVLVNYVIMLGFFVNFFVRTYIAKSTTIHKKDEKKLT